MSEPKHGGDGFEKVVTPDGPMYYGLCKCGWRCPVHRFRECSAVEDYAEHIHEILTHKKRKYPKQVEKRNE